MFYRMLAAALGCTLFIAAPSSQSQAGPVGSSPTSREVCTTTCVDVLRDCSSDTILKRCKVRRCTTVCEIVRE